MFIRLLILFIVIPIVEIYVLLQAGEIIGLGPTVALVLLTGVAGAYLARTQGSETVRKIQLALERGEMPTEELLDGAMILAGGLTLLTPGFCTDLAGFCLLVPVTRNMIKQWVRHWLEKMSSQGNIRIYRG
ncbi:FxsA family protein [Desulfuromonas acetoxidans]|uniref:FxsA cytoplasmic membrane protein n=1 Tax=Desulfuromonas acetoxidans (strain DSM 684 / 11070) TaxID=281689 RepID=Q1K0K6_DESA6|nr:FxsA family protein [Desulfuromonas acetoxidans]EAT15935.1 FxsA cytoplasmic membrane protein [Desulfuromonas acetoxidans DSM 684]MBF0644167.1 membrane protein FxsA [Desulfuromonas acetoxidans]NVD24535.1 membrane protein FxsA [Desulfuromonas acetoxidans]NVE16515.1 membrane protein FxsA [Desulfuromonas acetoxidans]